jgi:CTP synthase
MLGSQFHPEFKSRPTRPHPLFSTFIQATRQHAGLTETVETLDITPIPANHK